MKWARRVMLGGLLALGALCALLPWALAPTRPAEAQVFGNLRTESYTIEAYHHIGTSTGAALHYNGTLLVSRIDENAAGGIDGTWTTSVAALPYPARLDIRLHDLGAATAAMACATVQVWGYDQFGGFHHEQIGSSQVDEAETLTTYAYDRVNRIQWTSCGVSPNFGQDSADRLLVRMSDHIGLPRKIRDNGDVLAVCRRQVVPTAITSTTQPNWNTTWQAGEQSLLQELKKDLNNVTITTLTECNRGTDYTITRRSNTLDLQVGVSVGGMEIGTGDTVIIRTRAPILYP